MAYNSRYTQQGYENDEQPINTHDLSDDEGDLGEGNLDDDIRLESVHNPFEDTSYQGYNPPAFEDLVSDAPHYAQDHQTQSQVYNLHDETSSHGSYDQEYKEFDSSKSYDFLKHDVRELESTYAESDPEAAFRKRQQPLKRGHTRRVKLVNGDIFCTDYP